MAKVAEGDKRNFKRESKPQAYPPSWVDRFTAWLTRLPGPTGLYYLGIGLVLFLLQTAMLWVEGAYPIGTFNPSHVFVAAVIPFLLALFHYLDNAAGAALTTLRPALKTSEQEYSQLRYQLTTLPARPTLLTSLAGLTFVVLLGVLIGRPASVEALATSPISQTLIYPMFVSVWWVFGALIYHTVNQLRMINLIYTRYTRINLFRMRPLYAFSRVTALTAVSLTAGIYVWYFLNPDLLYNPIGFWIALLITGLAVGTFVWPLLGIHRLLVKEKERLLDENSQLLEAEVVELHQRLNSGNLEGLDNLNRAIASLEIEQNALSRTPTWPWQPETVRLLLTALFLPLGLWIIQVVLQLVFGP